MRVSVGVVVRFALAAIVLIGTGCAATRAEKLPFTEAFAGYGRTASAVEPERSKSPVAATRSKRRAPSGATGTVAADPATVRTNLTARESLALQAQLIRFGNRARDLRASASRRARMPPAAQRNWEEMLDTLDAFLDQAAEATAPTDVVRARATIDAELELDARTWRDFPTALTARVNVRITRLGVRMAEVRRLGVAPSRAHATFDWPIDPVSVTSLFGRRLHPVSRTWRSHLGIDLGAYRGQLVVAAGEGTVVRAGWKGAHGRHVEIHHGGGVVTRYSHLSATLVEPGARVRKGDPIGLAGQSGVATGPHLHFEFWRDGRPEDPLEEIPAQRERPAQRRDVPRS